MGAALRGLHGKLSEGGADRLAILEIVDGSDPFLLLLLLFRRILGDVSRGAVARRIHHVFIVVVVAIAAIPSTLGRRRLG